MGSKGSKNNKNGNPKPEIVQKDPTGLKDADYTFLVAQTGMSKENVKAVFERFSANNPDSKLDRKEFTRLYDELRSEPPEILDEISNNIFDCFDTDDNGFVTFSEFMIAYALTSRGDMKKKLEYAFVLYDADNNGTLDMNEVRKVVTSMLDMLGAQKKSQVELNALVNECLNDLDATNDDKISKDEFINGLQKNYSLRALMSPFN